MTGTAASMTSLRDQTIDLRCTARRSNGAPPCYVLTCRAEGRFAEGTPMYMPKHFEETDVAVLQALIRAHPLGALVTLTPGGLDANHIPFLMHSGAGAYGTLHGHVPRANPVWRE